MLRSLIFALLIFNPLSVFAGAPEEHVRSHISSLQEILLDKSLSGKENLVKRRALAKVLLNRMFDFEEMSRRSLGAIARKYPEKIKEFTALFVELLEDNYMSTIEENGDVKIIFSGEKIENDYSEVASRAILKNGEDYKVAYKLHFVQNSWRVYDLSVENISIVNNYRSQFNRYLSRKTFDDLLADLRNKTARFN